MFLMAPDFSSIALQDSQGERGQNSLADTAAFLGNCSAAAARQGRDMWSNIELCKIVILSRCVSMSIVSQIDVEKVDLSHLPSR